MRNYLIIGGGSGIGKALVEKLHAAGHSIYSTYFNSPIKGEDSNLHVRKYDVLTEEFSADFLPSVIDGFIYCPGAIQLTPFGRIKMDKLQVDLNLQVFGAIKTIQKVIPHLLLSEDASIVLFSSVAVQTGFKYHAQVAVSKGAIEGPCPFVGL